MDTLLKEQIDIKKRLKNIELLSEINNNPNFSKKNLKEETESVIRKSFLDIYESMNSRHHSSFFKKIKTKLLEKLHEMRGGIASRVKSAIFEIFGESQLPRIDFQSSSAEINSWNSTFFKSQDKGDSNFRKFIKKTNENKFYGELETEQTSEKKSEEWEEEERSPKRRKTSGGHVLSPRLGSPRLGSPWLGSFRLVSPRLTSSRPVSPQLFESSDTPDTSDTTREEGDITGGDTEGVEIVGQ
ncbi:hypothetical protein Glove_102g66 [Diversispora epigaea]|uniref:Uncharacterized protein n=1 Tax=Diversispora epigaea TaxID=1348612 RepID=A0A397JE50_9GLOM|nr:hypothetical protein Glove_102g66 [Diversispora epigaea]